MVVVVVVVIVVVVVCGRGISRTRHRDRRSGDASYGNQNSQKLFHGIPSKSLNRLMVSSAADRV
jgi:hypothetical protein